MINYPLHTVYLETVDSTNSYIKQLIKENNKVGNMAVVAYEQTAGRGRLGRVWQSKKGDTLCMSMAVNTDYAEGFTLLAALGVYDALKKLSPESNLLIKWPNDIICNNKKLCGILCERVGEYTIIGIGVNLNDVAFSDDISYKATSLHMLNGKNFELEIVAEGIISSLVSILNKYNNVFSKEAREKYLSLCANIGKKASTAKYSGVACDIGVDGSLVIETDTGLKNVSSSEVVIHGIY